MVKLCLMASQGYLPCFAFHSQQPIRRLSQDYHPLLFGPESTQDLVRPALFAMNPLSPHQVEQPFYHMRGLLDSNKFVSIDSAIKRRVIDAQAITDNRLDALLFSYGIARECRSQGEILEFLSSGLSEMEGSLNLSVLDDLMRIQAIPTEMSQCLYAPDYESCFHDAESQTTVFSPRRNFYSEKPLLDLAGDLAHKSVVGDLEDQVAFTSARTEMKGIHHIIAEYYLTKNSTKWKKLSVVVPYFDRLQYSKARANINGSVKLEPLNFVPLKSPRRTRQRSSRKKSYSRKVGKEKVVSRQNYSYSCESLLSIIVDKKRHGKTAILELKKSGPELSHLLTQFSAGIAGTGLALLFSVVCKVATGRVPFCTSKLLNTGLGFGLVWLSWAVNSLRDMIISITKNSGKRALKEEQMLENLDSSVKEIFFRAVTLMAVMVLRLA